MISEQQFPKRALTTRGDSSTVEILLTRGFVALVDSEDYERLGHLKWTAQAKRSGLVYAYRNEPSEDGKLRNVFLHRVIAACPTNLFVDHINRNTLDCRRANLRICTPAQNTRNRTMRPSKHGYPGIDSQSAGRFRGRVMFEGRSFYTPTFSTASAAAIARDALALRLHGEFAVSNVQPGQPG